MPQLEHWNEFVSQYKGMDKDLQQFQNAVQELGSSLDLVVTIEKMRENLSTVFCIFENNAIALFPQRIKRFRSPRFNKRWHNPLGLSHDHGLYGSRGTSSLHPGDLSLELRALSESINRLKDAMIDFPEFGQLADYCSQAVQLYIQDISKEVGNDFEEISQNIVAFTYRAPAVLMSQKRAISNLQSLSAMATFFSGVTATMIQFSQANNGDGLWEVVNAFWFGSLVLSVASALSGFLAYSWRNAMYSSPKPRLRGGPWKWIRFSPTIFLVLSVVSFLAGLACFVSVSQTRGTQVVVLCCELMSISTLAALALWSLADKWKYNRIRHFHTPATNEPDNATELNTSDDSSTSTRASSISYSIGGSSHSIISSTPVMPTSTDDNVNDADPTPTSPPPQEPAPRILTLSPHPTQKRFRRLVVKVMAAERMIQNNKELQLVARLIKQLRFVTPTGQQIRDDRNLLGYPQFSPDGNVIAVAAPTHTLQCDFSLPGSKSIADRSSYTGNGPRQVVWSSSGAYLLTWTYQKTFIDVWSTHGTSTTIKRGNQVGLVMSLPEPNDETDSTHPRFILAEGKTRNIISCIGVDGHEYFSEELDNIRIDHMDVSSQYAEDSGPLIAMAVTVTSKSTQSHPAHALPMRRLMIFDVNTPTTMSEIPVWKEVEDISFSKDADIIAISYRDQPPQLWSIQCVDNVIRLSLLRQLHLRSATEKFVGKIHWLSTGHFLLSVTNDGQIYFWSKGRGDPVHIIPASEKDEDKTVDVGCKPIGDDFTFATRSRDGVIRIWKAYEAEKTSEAQEMSPATP
ncbi:hypothetical protein BU17DRAFT_84732 [Hysterangium stoloniferum]|nr:hypothetical protein BU17DRAFT_84732 [Hysterangium stoloniferum]